MFPSLLVISFYPFDLIRHNVWGSHTLWAQHSSGTFAQLDLRHSHGPIDAIPRASVAWEAGRGLVFVWEMGKVGSSL